MDNNILKERLRETLRKDKQETVARKLHTSQGNVSKWLSGTTPKTEYLYDIAREYHVSIDWLLGLSDQKETAASKTTYASITEAFLTAINCGAVKYEDDGTNAIKMHVEDEVLTWLILKGLDIGKTDREYYRDWIEHRLSMFRDKQLLGAGHWLDKDTCLDIWFSLSEKDLLSKYEELCQKS